MVESGVDGNLNGKMGQRIMMAEQRTRNYAKVRNWKRCSSESD